MEGLQWLVLLGVAVFVVLLFYLAWAYSRGRLTDARNDPPDRSRWLPHGLRMRPLGHGIYHAHDERRNAGQKDSPPER